jgi:hypothetical protein
MTTSKFTKTATARAAAPTAKPTATKAPRITRKVVDNTDAQTAYAERVSAAQQEYMESQHVPSGTRLVVAAVSRLLTFSVSIYWGLEATGLIMTAAIALTGSSFIAFVVGLTAALLAFSAAWQAGSAVGQFLINFDQANAARIGHDLRIAAAKRVNLVRGWFKKPDITDPIDLQSANVGNA